jgi:hypothetical protein
MPLPELTEGLAGTEVTFGAAMCPEFHRVGSGVADFFALPSDFVGTFGARVTEAVTTVLGFLSLPVRVVDVHVAEALKCARDAFQATNPSASDQPRSQGAGPMPWPERRREFRQRPGELATAGPEKIPAGPTAVEDCRRIRPVRACGGASVAVPLFLATREPALPPRPQLRAVCRPPGIKTRSNVGGGQQADHLFGRLTKLRWSTRRLGAVAIGHANLRSGRQR